MLNRGESREDHGNAKCTGQQRREDETWGHYALQYYRRKINYLSRPASEILRPCAALIPLFRAKGVQSVSN
jgi:hypothetical protein